MLNHKRAKMNRALLGTLFVLMFVLTGCVLPTGQKAVAFDLSDGTQITIPAAQLKGWQLGEPTVLTLSAIRDGHPVDDVDFTLRLQLNEHLPAETFEVVPERVGPGDYRAVIEWPAEGFWWLQLVATVNGERSFDGRGPFPVGDLPSVSTEP